MQHKILFKSKDLLIKKIKWDAKKKCETKFHNHDFNCFYKVLKG
jgi:hypothetical protein